MTVAEFRNLITQHSDAMATRHLRALKKRKLGFAFKQIFTSNDEIIHSIVAEAVLDANEPLLESSKVRTPEWMTTDTFNSLTAKMSIYASNYI